MELHDLLGNGQTESAALVAAAAASVSREELVKEVLAVGVINAGPGVLYGELHVVVPRRQGNGNGRPGRRKLDRVVNKIRHRLDLSHVSVYEVQALGLSDLQGYLTLLRPRLHLCGPIR